MTKPFTIAGRLKSVGYALEGLRTILRTQHNAWLHLAATLAVLVAGMALSITPIEWTVLILAVAVVWVAEGLNTAFELLCDVASPQFHPLVKQAKDVAAGAVLIAAAAAVAVGAFIFLPRLF